jgi:4-aminobutyrate aminotransferase-like enzyme
LTADLANVAAVFSIRGLGLIAGVELRENNSPASKLTLGTIKRMLQRGFILLPEGEASNVISLTPPLTISSTQLCSALKALAVTLHSIR